MREQLVCGRTRFLWRSYRHVDAEPIVSARQIAGTRSKSVPRARARAPRPPLRVRRSARGADRRAVPRRPSNVGTVVDACHTLLVVARHQRAGDGCGFHWPHRPRDAVAPRVATAWTAALLRVEARAGSAITGTRQDRVRQDPQSIPALPHRRRTVLIRRTCQPAAAQPAAPRNMRHTAPPRAKIFAKVFTARTPKLMLRKAYHLK